MLSLIQKVEDWLKNNNVQKVGNFLISMGLWIIKHKFLAGIFFGFFIVANKDLFLKLWNSFKGMFMKEAQVVETKVETAVKNEETKIVDEVKSKL